MGCSPTPSFPGGGNKQVEQKTIYNKQLVSTQINNQLHINQEINRLKQLLAHWLANKHLSHLVTSEGWPKKLDQPQYRAKGQQIQTQLIIQ